ncbi:uncharacterized protein LOC135489933 [Lineus longissimus]|uniref:uncharacterized protein LOC135489933 n=1 Tax=Lineus longissimus TaxID=88925 RepID=UPI00315CCE8E
MAQSQGLKSSRGVRGGRESARGGRGKLETFGRTFYKMNEKKKIIHFTPATDILLLREVLATNPFESVGLWDKVAENVNTALVKTGSSASVTARTVRERAQRLMQKHRANEMKSLRKTNEEYEEREQILTELIDLERESRENLEKQKEKNKQKNKSAGDCREAGLLIRKRALEALKPESPKASTSGGADASDDELVPEIKPAEKKPKKKKVDPIVEIMERKMDLEEKSEERMGKELEERQKERVERMEIIRLLMNKQNAKD